MKLTNLVPLDQIQLAIDNSYISKRKHPQLDYWILNYTHKTQIEWYWTPITINCRGLIVDSSWNIIARPFKKFFTLDQWSTLRNHVWNLYGVKYSEMFSGPFEILEKYDGSLGILFYNPQTKKHELASRGSFESDQAIRGTEILQKKYPDLMPLENTTYLFEIIYPENKIVVDYQDLEDIILLAVINNETGKEISINREVTGFSNLFNKVPIVEKYNFINTDWRSLDKLNWKNAEGFVVRFLNNDIRVKIKFEEYKSLAKILNSLDERLVLEWTKNKINFEQVIYKLPLEQQKWVYQLYNDYITKYTKIETESRRIVERDKCLTRKEFACLHKNLYFSSVLFAMLDGKDYQSTIWKIIEKDIIKEIINEPAKNI